MNARRLMVMVLVMTIGLRAPKAWAEEWEPVRAGEYPLSNENLRAVTESRGYGLLFPATVTTTTTTTVYRPYDAVEERPAAYPVPQPAPAPAPVYAQPVYARPVYVQQAAAAHPQTYTYVASYAQNYAPANPQAYAPTYSMVPAPTAYVRPAYAPAVYGSPVSNSVVYRPVAQTYAPVCATYSAAAAPVYPAAACPAPAAAPQPVGPRVWVHEKVYVEGQPIRNFLKAITP